MTPTVNTETIREAWASVAEAATKGTSRRAKGKIHHVCRRLVCLLPTAEVRPGPVDEHALHVALPEAIHNA